eukprot:gene836-9085_t
MDEKTYQLEYSRWNKCYDVKPLEYLPKEEYADTVNLINEQVTKVYLDNSNEKVALINLIYTGTVFFMTIFGMSAALGFLFTSTGFVVSGDVLLTSFVIFFCIFTFTTVFLFASMVPRFILKSCILPKRNEKLKQELKELENEMKTGSLKDYISPKISVEIKPQRVLDTNIITSESYLTRTLSSLLLVQDIPYLFLTFHQKFEEEGTTYPTNQNYTPNEQI